MIDAKKLRSNSGKKEEKRPPLTQYMMEGDFFIGASLATTLAKLALRYKKLETNLQKSNRLQAEAMMVMTSVLQLGRSGLPSKAMTHDDAERLSLCLRALACPSEVTEQIFRQGCREALGRMLAAKAEEDSQNQKAKEKPGQIVQVWMMNSFKAFFAQFTTAVNFQQYSEISCPSCLGRRFHSIPAIDSRFGPERWIRRCL